MKGDRQSLQGRGTSHPGPQAPPPGPAAWLEEGAGRLKTGALKPDCLSSNLDRATCNSGVLRQGRSTLWASLRCPAVKRAIVIGFNLTGGCEESESHRQGLALHKHLRKSCQIGEGEGGCQALLGGAKLKTGVLGCGPRQVTFL